MTKWLQVSLLLPMLMAPSNVTGQTASKAWTVMLGGNVSTVSLGPEYTPAWRSAWGFDLRLNVTSHVHVGLSGSSPFSWREVINPNCPDTRAGCVIDYGAPHFSIMAGAIGAHGDVGRFSPFFELGGGQITLNGDDHTTWLFDGGTATHLAGLIDLVAACRIMQAPRPLGGRAVVQEWSIGLSVETPPLWQ